MTPEINKKQKELESLGKLIDSVRERKAFTREAKQDEENISFVLEKQLKDLLLEFRLKELDTKIEAYRQMLKLLK